LRQQSSRKSFDRISPAVVRTALRADPLLRRRDAEINRPPRRVNRFLEASFVHDGKRVRGLFAKREKKEPAIEDGMTLSRFYAKPIEVIALQVLA
jgi:hypothetical protein